MSKSLHTAETRSRHSRLPERRRERRRSSTVVAVRPVLRTHPGVRRGRRHRCVGVIRRPMLPMRGMMPVTGPPSGCSIGVPAVIASGSNEMDSMTGSHRRGTGNWSAGPSRPRRSAADRRSPSMRWCAVSGSPIRHSGRWPEVGRSEKSLIRPQWVGAGVAASNY
jgi:hypothetical protein